MAEDRCGCISIIDGSTLPIGVTTCGSEMHATHGYYSNMITSKFKVSECFRYVQMAS